MRALWVALLLAGCAAGGYEYQTYIDVPYSTPEKLADEIESAWQGKARKALDECYGKVDEHAPQARIAVDNYLINCMKEKGFAFRIVREKRKVYEK